MFATIPRLDFLLPLVAVILGWRLLDGIQSRDIYSSTLVPLGQTFDEY
jgi:hypothetical protein